MQDESRSLHSKSSSRAVLSAHICIILKITFMQIVHGLQSDIYFIFFFTSSYILGKFLISV